MNNKKSLIYSIIAVLLIVAIVAGGTFAYFQWTSGADDKTSVNVTIEAGQITMHIEPDNTVYTGLRPTNSCNNAVAYGDALMTIVNNTGAMAIPSFKLSVKVTKNGTGNLTSDDLSHIHYSVVPVETTASGGKGDSAADCANPVSFTVEDKDLYFEDITTGSATGTFATVSTAGEWSDLPSASSEYLPRQFNTVDVTPYGVTFLGKPHTTSYQWFRVYVWIDEGYTFTNTGTDITDPLQNAKIEVTWSTNSMLEQVSSIISGGDEEVVKAAGLYAPDGTFTSWDTLVANGDVKVDSNGVLTSSVYDDSNYMYVPANLSGELVIPDGITSIGDDAFTNTSLTSVVISDSVTEIGDCAFMQSQITKVTFGNNSQLTSIGSSAFQQSALEEITYGDNSKLESIGSGAFSWTALKEFIIPASVTFLGSENFWENLGRNNIIFEANSQLKTIIKNTFSYCYGLPSVPIPLSVTRIETGAFMDSDITEIKYEGTMAQWNEIELESGWNIANGFDYSVALEKVICSDGTIEL